MLVVFYLMVLSDFKPTDIRRNVLQAVAYIQQCAAERRTQVAVCGDWILFSAESGDAFICSDSKGRDRVIVGYPVDGDPQGSERTVSVRVRIPYST